MSADRELGQSLEYPHLLKDLLLRVHLGEVPVGDWPTRTVGMASRCATCRSQREYMTVSRAAVAVNGQAYNKIETYHFCPKCDLGEPGPERAVEW